MNDHATRIEGAARPRLERRARASARGRGYVISVTLLAVIWSDALALALAGFLVANTVHAVNHVVDLDLGGRGSDPWLLGLVSVLIAVALALRLKEIGYVVGAVGTAATPKLEPFVRQKTALLVTYRRDGVAIHGRARRLEGAEARQAAHALARKHPLLQGVLVPFMHRVGRAHSGRTVHFELVPLER